MDQPVALYRSSIGKKVLMAVSGLILLGFLLGHMAGNLKAFMGPDHFNEYAHFLREMGEPLVPYSVLLWIVRLVLLASLAVHVVAAIQLWRRDKAARAVNYRRYRNLAISPASKAMLWGGITIFAFVIYHLMHFTIGNAHHDFRPGDAYHNLVSGLQNPVIAIAYLLVLIPLAMHLYHGFWAAFNSLGAGEQSNDMRRTLAAVIAGAIVLGFATVPIAVLAGILEIGG